MKLFKNIFNKIKNTRRRTKIIGILVILFVLFLIFRGQKKPIEPIYQTVSVNDIESLVSASGVLSGKNVAVLHFNTAGKLNYLPVKNGDTVVKGQVIATLDSTQANAAYQEALNNRRNTQANVDYVHDQVKDHSGDETFAEKAARTAAEAANDSAYDSVLAAQEALKATTLTSPISGVVVAQNNLNAGQNIGPTDIVATVVDFSSKVMETTVDESDIGLVTVGQSADITFNTYGETLFGGKIIEITPATQTDSTGAITVTVKIVINDSRIAQIYGLNGNANIITSSKQNVLTISQDALIDDNHVYVKGTNGKPEKRELVTGIKSDTEVEIVSGLNAGDQVVTNPQTIAK